MVRINILNLSNSESPSYAKLGDAGMDIRAKISEPRILKPLERCLFSTGLYVDIPDGYEIQIRPRSGLALKKGITVLNTPGTIDAGYTGEIGVILVNLSNEDVEITPGERIAQMVCCKFETMELIEVGEITKQSERGSGGFGSSGKY